MASLTENELEVMNILWQYGELKPAEMQAHYPRPIQNAALRFQLKVLLEKKHITRRKVGKAYYYRAATARDGVLRKMIRRMSEVFSQGSAVGLIAEMIQQENLSPDEIKQLQKLARTQTPAPKPTAKRKGRKS